MLIEFIYNLSVYGGISLAAFLIFLLARDLRQLNKRILIGILLHFLLLFAAYAFVSASIALRLMPIFLVLIYTLGPLVHTYVEAVYDSQLQLDKSFYYRLAPAVLAGIALATIHLAPLSDIIHLGAILSLSIIGLAVLWWYSIKAYRKLRHYRRLLREEYANVETHDLQWLSNWMIGLLLLLVADIILGLAVSVIPALQDYLHLNVLGYAIFIVYIGYQGLAQEGVFLPARLTKPPSKPSTPNENQSHPSLGSEDEIQHYISSLTKVVQEEELFRQDDLSLRSLAEQLSMTDKQLSTLLNQHLDTSFYAYINQYRVAAFQEALTRGDAEQYTLLAIALECGFSSKSSFNRIFKQHTGLTPTAYKNSRTQ
ncbi:MAG: helix-turn-helix domain-containing protein [Bacteroidota bacterium]